MSFGVGLIGSSRRDVIWVEKVSTSRSVCRNDMWNVQENMPDVSGTRRLPFGTEITLMLFSGHPYIVHTDRVRILLYLNDIGLWPDPARPWNFNH